MVTNRPTQPWLLRQIIALYLNIMDIVLTYAIHSRQYIYLILNSEYVTLCPSVRNYMYTRTPQTVVGRGLGYNTEHCLQYTLLCTANNL